MNIRSLENTTEHNIVCATTVYARHKGDHTMQNHTCVMLLVDEKLVGILKRRKN